MLVIIMGLPGSGKSFFAQNLADILNCHYLNSDVIRDNLGLRGNYTQKAKHRVYDEILKKVNSLAKKNEIVLVDGTFHQKTIRNLFLEKAQSLNQKIYFLEVWAKENLIKERTKEKRKYSEANFDVYLKIKNAYDPISFPCLKLESTNYNLKDMLEKACKYLKVGDDK